MGGSEDRREMTDRSTSGGVWTVHTFTKLHVRDSTTKEGPADSINIIIKSVINTEASIAQCGLAHRSLMHSNVEGVCEHTHKSQSGKDRNPL